MGVSQVNVYLIRFHLIQNLQNPSLVSPYQTDSLAVVYLSSEDTLSRVDKITPSKKQGVLKSHFIRKIAPQQTFILITL